MKTILTGKILRRMLVLGFLLISLGFFVSTDSLTQSAKAEPLCCSDCIPFFQDCQNMCSEAPYPGCAMVCYHFLSDCNATCDTGC
jgi:hypothetical protein